MKIEQINISFDLGTFEVQVPKINYVRLLETENKVYQSGKYKLH